MQFDLSVACHAVQAADGFIYPSNKVQKSAKRLMNCDGGSNLCLVCNPDALALLSSKLN